MAESSYPTANSAVTDANYELLMATGIGDGLIGRPTLSVLIYADSSGRQVKARASRGAIVRGFRWFTDSAGATLAIPANTSGQARKDLIVLRLDRTNYTVRLACKVGTPAASPVAPTPTFADPPAQLWELPLATVNVANNFTTVAAGDVTETTWYLAEPSIVGTAAYTPPGAPGRVFLQGETILIGDSGGNWDPLIRDSGWITLATTSGWGGNRGIKMRRKDNTVYLNIATTRTGATVASTTDSVLCTLAAAYRPDGIIDGVAHISSPDHSTDFWIDPSSGQVTLNGDKSNPINNDAYIWGNVSWPASF